MFLVFPFLPLIFFFSFDSGELATTHSSIKPKTPPLFSLKTYDGEEWDIKFGFVFFWFPDIFLCLEFV